MKDITREQLCEQYVAEGKSLQQIADDLGCSLTNVYRIFVGYGIPRRKRGPTAMQRLLDEQWLRGEYEGKNRTCDEISKELHCGRTTVKQALVRLGIPTKIGRIRDEKIKSNYLKSDTFCSVHRLRGAMITLFGHHCQMEGCDYDKFVDVHHIEGVGYREGSQSRKHTENKISNSVLLCPNHHRESDNGTITRGELHKIILSRKLKT